MINVKIEFLKKNINNKIDLTLTENQFSVFYGFIKYFL